MKSFILIHFIGYLSINKSVEQQ